MSRRRSVSRSSQQLRDDARNEQRKAMIDPTAFQDMVHHLRASLGAKYYKLDFLKALAKKTARESGCSLDRCAKRKKEMIIVWFIENWQYIRDKLSQNLIILMQNPEQFLANEAADYAPGIEEVEPDVQEVVYPETAQVQVQENVSCDFFYQDQNENDSFIIYDNNFEEPGFDLDGFY